MAAQASATRIIVGNGVLADDADTCRVAAGRHPDHTARIHPCPTCAMPVVKRREPDSTGDLVEVHSIEHRPQHHGCTALVRHHVCRIAARRAVKTRRTVSIEEGRVLRARILGEAAQ